MFYASGAARRLGFAALVVVGMSCGDDAPRTRPTALAAPLTSCAERPLQPHALQLPIWDLFVVDSSWDALHADVRADVEVNAQLCIQGRLEPIGLELQGVSGRGRDKKSFKIKFAREQDFARLGFEDRSQGRIDKVYLKAMWIDPSMMREALAFDLWREMGHDAPRTGVANLRINGDYWGLYAIVEPIDEEYLQRNGYPAGGHLYQATRKNGSRADFEPGRNLVKAFEDKGDHDPSEVSPDLAQLVATLQKTPLDDASFERVIDPIFPLDDYIDRMVWVAFTQNSDAVAQNFYLYGVRRDDRTIWHQIPWDSDLCMSASWRDRNAMLPPGELLLLDGGNYFGRRLVLVPGLRERYLERFRNVIDEVLAEPIVLRHLERHADYVRSDLLRDQLRWQRDVTPGQAFDVVRKFVEQRPAILRRALDTWPE